MMARPQSYYGAIHCHPSVETHNLTIVIDHTKIHHLMTYLSKAAFAENFHYGKVRERHSFLERI